MNAAALPLRVAIVGAGPAGLALALGAARLLPDATVTVYDSRPAGRDIGADPRTLALALGSVHWLGRLGVWPREAAQPITEIHVSQAQAAWLPCPALAASGDDDRGREGVLLRAAERGLPMYGAVLSYGALTAALQRAWLAAAAAAPARLASRFGCTVASLRRTRAGVEVAVDAAGPGGVVEHHDLAVVAEGGVFAEQLRKAVSCDYHQTAWVGSARLAGATPGRAIERFTAHGPLALLPQGDSRAALVWCVDARADPVRALDDAARHERLAALVPAAAGRIESLGVLKPFALGLNAERTLVAGRTVRIGNAAQTLHPVAGQGLNLGLRDAVALLESLRAAPAGPDAVDRALARFERRRLADRWSMIATTDFLARSFTWRLPGLASLRGLGLAGLAACAPARHALEDRMMFGRR